MKLVGDVLEKRGAGRGEDDVGHVEEQVGHLRAVPEHEQRHVALRSHKAQSMSVMSEPLVPRAGRLLKSIEGLVEQADMLRPRGVEEAGRLLTVNHLVEIAMEKGVLDVELVYRPCTRDGDAEDDADGGGLDDRTERLVEVNARLLSEGTNNPARLVASESTIRTKLVLEDPLP